ncbi:MAG: hypothetical protein KAS17_11870 [Victivallaceae bacterium]|nr:hypothetical protein [Victivallaceae bacterium]
MRFLLLVISITMLAGCVGLPPGKAPDGSIVNPKLAKKEYSKIGAKNYMLTSLSMFCLQNFPQGAKFHVDFKNLNKKVKSSSLDVLCSVRESVPIRVANKSDATYRVNSEINKENIWSMRLTELKTKKVVWLEQLKIEKDK